MLQRRPLLLASPPEAVQEQHLGWLCHVRVRSQHQVRPRAHQRTRNLHLNHRGIALEFVAPVDAHDAEGAPGGAHCLESGLSLAVDGEAQRQRRDDVAWWCGRSAPEVDGGARVCDAV